MVSEKIPALEENRIDAIQTGQLCAFCTGRTFRRSRLKFKDMGRLLSLQYPVRCLSCSKRQSVGMDVARKAVPSTVRQVRAAESSAAWDGSPWSKPHAAEDVARAGSGVSVPLVPVSSTGSTAAMPDLHGVTLPHVAQMPPGDGENLA